MDDGHGETPQCIGLLWLTMDVKAGLGLGWACVDWVSTVSTTTRREFATSHSHSHTWTHA